MSKHQNTGNQQTDKTDKNQSDALLIISCLLLVTFIVAGLIYRSKDIIFLGFILPFLLIIFYYKVKGLSVSEKSNIKYFLWGFVDLLLIFPCIPLGLLIFEEETKVLTIFLLALFLMQSYQIITKEINKINIIKYIFYGFFTALLSIIFCLCIMYWIDPVGTQLGIFLPILIGFDDLKSYLFDIHI